MEGDRKHLDLGIKEYYGSKKISPEMSIALEDMIERFYMSGKAEIRENDDEATELLNNFATYVDINSNFVLMKIPGNRDFSRYDFKEFAGKKANVVLVKREKYLLKEAVKIIINETDLNKETLLIVEKSIQEFHESKEINYEKEGVSISTKIDGRSVFFKVNNNTIAHKYIEDSYCSSTHRDILKIASGIKTLKKYYLKKNEYIKAFYDYKEIKVQTERGTISTKIVTDSSKIEYIELRLDGFAIARKNKDYTSVTIQLYQSFSREFGDKIKNILNELDYVNIYKNRYGTFLNKNWCFSWAGDWIELFQDGSMIY